jgi:hypothetical protein
VERNTKIEDKAGTWGVARDTGGTPDEEWRAVAGFEEYYQVSNLGRVRSLRRMKPLVGSIDSCGYHRVTLWTPHGQSTGKVHRLVCRAFHGPPNILHREVAHLDNDRLNNRAANLKWVSHAENIYHKRIHGTHGAGEKHPGAKLTNAEIDLMVAGFLSGERSRAIAARFGVSWHTVNDIRSGRSWRHISRPTIPRQGLHGANNPSAVMSWDTAQEIRRRKAGGESAEALYKEYGIGRATIYKLLAGETYRK